LKILLIHNYYTLHGGEDVVFIQERDLLKEKYEVKTVEFRNKNGIIGAIQVFFSVWNIFACIKVRRAILAFRPNVIHMHNLHFASGPIVIRVAKRMGIPVVLTLHNYRLLCPSATLLHKNRIFSDSIITSFPWRAIHKGVYRKSRVLTFWLAFIAWVHKKLGTWAMVDRFILFTPFAKEIFINSNLGIPQEKFIIKPNFIVERDNPITVRKNHFLYVGRLSEEKGISTLLETFKDRKEELHIIGTGPLQPQVNEYSKAYENIRYIGGLDPQGVKNAMLECTALLFPSICYEGMPLTILEAFSSGTAVIGSKLGSMDSMIKHRINGLHFKPGDAKELLTQIIYWQNLEKKEKENFSANAKQIFSENYTSDINLIQLTDIYRSIFKN
jgi:glycosyltransferase involved in cell wall biosynthesis